MLPDLSRSVLRDGEAVFELPEKVLQFGTGAFLRGFTDYFVDVANRAGRFGGRVVAVGSTGSGRAGRLSEQDGLYTVCLRGLQQGEPVERCRVVASVSRALSAKECWRDVLACAADPALALVVSNTTEVGIRLDEEDRLDLDPPRSFPGKLTAVLYERARAFDYDPARGLLILPCELIERNGDALREIVLALAEQWGLPARFRTWAAESNRFCNTLVDRIVPGTPDEAALEAAWSALGYRDDLLIEAEPYALWAVEGDDAVRARLPVGGNEAHLVVTDDIEPYRERKVRLLNGTHTAATPLSLLCGNETVRDTMTHPQTGPFVRRLMLDEVAPFLDSDAEAARAFAHEVLDRFANPFIRHRLLDITFQQTTKLGVRVVPSLVAYWDRRGALPPCLLTGVAAYFHYLRTGQPSRRDDEAGRVVEHGREAGWTESGLRRILSDRSLWPDDLAARIPPLPEALAGLLARMEKGEMFNSQWVNGQ